MRRSPAVVMITMLAVLLGACGSYRYPDHEQVSPAERTVLKFSHVVAENTPKGLGARRFAATVKQRTAGHVEVQVFPNSQLFGDGEEMTALRSGAVQIIAPSTSKLADLDPMWQVFDLPYLFRDEQDVDRLVAGPTGQQLYANLRRQGFEPIAFWHGGFKHVTNSRTSLLLPGSVAGLRFRIQPSPVMRDAFQGMGAEVSILTFDALYGALADKRIDGQENSPTNIVSKRIHEVQGYMTVTNHGYQGYVILVDQAFWNKLPPEMRETLRETMSDATQWVRDNAPVLNEEAMERIRATGKVIIHTQTANERELWRTAMQGAYRRTEERLGTEVVQQAVREAWGR